MGFLDGISSQTIFLCVAALMLFGSFATINSAQSTKMDHDFALFLLIAGLGCGAIGFGLIDMSMIKNFLPSSHTGN